MGVHMGRQWCTYSQVHGCIHVATHGVVMISQRQLDALQFVKLSYTYQPEPHDTVGAEGAVLLQVI